MKGVKCGNCAWKDECTGIGTCEHFESADMYVQIEIDYNADLSMRAAEEHALALEYTDGNADNG